MKNNNVTSNTNIESSQVDINMNTNQIRFIKQFIAEPLLNKSFCSYKNNNTLNEESVVHNQSDTSSTNNRSSERENTGSISFSSSSSSSSSDFFIPSNQTTVEKTDKLYPKQVTAISMQYDIACKKTEINSNIKNKFIMNEVNKLCPSDSLITKTQLYDIACQATKEKSKDEKVQNQIKRLCLNRKLLGIEQLAQSASQLTTNIGQIEKLSPRLLQWAEEVILFKTQSKNEKIQQIAKRWNLLSSWLLQNEQSKKVINNNLIQPVSYAPKNLFKESIFNFEELNNLYNNIPLSRYINKLYNQYNKIINFYYRLENNVKMYGSIVLHKSLYDIPKKCGIIVSNFFTNKLLNLLNLNNHELFSNVAPLVTEAPRSLITSSTNASSYTASNISTLIGFAVASANILKSELDLLLITFYVKPLSNIINYYKHLNQSSNNKISLSDLSIIKFLTIDNYVLMNLTDIKFVYGLLQSGTKYLYDYITHPVSYDNLYAKLSIIGIRGNATIYITLWTSKIILNEIIAVRKLFNEELNNYKTTNKSISSMFVDAIYQRVLHYSNIITQLSTFWKSNDKKQKILHHFNLFSLIKQNTKLFKSLFTLKNWNISSIWLVCVYNATTNKKVFVSDIFKLVSSHYVGKNINVKFFITLVNIYFNNSSIYSFFSSAYTSIVEYCFGKSILSNIANNIKVIKQKWELIHEVFKNLSTRYGMPSILPTSTKDKTKEIQNISISNKLKNKLYNIATFIFSEKSLNAMSIVPNTLHSVFNLLKNIKNKNFNYIIECSNQNLQNSRFNMINNKYLKNIINYTKNNTTNIINYTKNNTTNIINYTKNNTTKYIRLVGHPLLNIYCNKYNFSIKKTCSYHIGLMTLNTIVQPDFITASKMDLFNRVFLSQNYFVHGLFQLLMHRILPTKLGKKAGIIERIFEPKDITGDVKRYIAELIIRKCFHSCFSHEHRFVILNSVPLIKEMNESDALTQTDIINIQKTYGTYIIYAYLSINEHFFQFNDNIIQYFIKCQQQHKSLLPEIIQYSLKYGTASFLPSFASGLHMMIIVELLLPKITNKLIPILNSWSPYIKGIKLWNQTTNYLWTKFVNSKNYIIQKFQQIAVENPFPNINIAWENINQKINRKQIYENFSSPSNAYETLKCTPNIAYEIISWIISTTVQNVIFFANKAFTYTISPFLNTKYGQEFAAISSNSWNWFKNTRPVQTIMHACNWSYEKIPSTQIGKKILSSWNKTVKKNQNQTNTNSTSSSPNTSPSHSPSPSPSPSSSTSTSKSSPFNWTNIIIIIIVLTIITLIVLLVYYISKKKIQKSILTKVKITKS